MSKTNDSGWLSLWAKKKISRKKILVKTVENTAVFGTLCIADTLFWSINCWLKEQNMCNELLCVLETGHVKCMSQISRQLEPCSGSTEDIHEKIWNSTFSKFRNESQSIFWYIFLSLVLNILPAMYLKERYSLLTLSEGLSLGYEREQCFPKNRTWQVQRLRSFKYCH